MGLMPYVFVICCFPCLLNDTGKFLCQVWWEVPLPVKQWQGEYADCTVPGFDMKSAFPQCTLEEAHKLMLGRSLCNRTAETQTTLDSACYHFEIEQFHRYSCKLRGKDLWPFWRPPAHFPTKGALILWCVLAGICCGLTVILNLLTGYVFARSPRLRNSKTVIYAANMAFIDLLIGFILLPLYILYTYDYNIQRFGKNAVFSESKTGKIVKWHAWIDLVLLVASFTNLAFMALERCIIVLHPFWHMSNVTYKKLGATLLLVWGYSIVTFFVENYAISSSVGNLWIAFSMGFIAPTVAIAISYCLIVIWLRRVGQAASDDGKMNAAQRNVEVKVSINLLLLKTVFLLCWLPYFTAFFIWTYKPSEKAAIAVRWTKLFSYFHCFLDPLLYAFSKPNIREEIILILRGRQRAKSVVTSKILLSRKSVASLPMTERPSSSAYD